MKLEEQVVSLDLAKRLKELGVPQESAFYWYTTPENDRRITHQLHLSEEQHEYRDGVKVGGVVCSAFTVGELGEMLPKGLCGLWNDDDRLGTTWQAHYSYHDHSRDAVSIGANSIVEACAKLLVHLLEKKIITPESLS